MASRSMTGQRVKASWWVRLTQRERQLLMLLGNLPRLVVATDAEVLFYIEQHQLMGRGIGYIDAHLLAAGALASPVRLWTRDRRLAAVAGELGMRN